MNVILSVLFAGTKTSGHYSQAAIVERWPLPEVRVFYVHRFVRWKTLNAA